MLNKLNLDKTEFRFLLGIVAVNIIIRIIYLWQYQSSVFWGNLTVDAEFHYLWAKSIVDGNLFGSEVFFRAPFYAYFTAVNFAIFSGNLLGIILVQNLIGIISLVLIYYLARQVFNIKTAIIALILYLFTFNFIFFESELLLDFMLVFFLPLIFLLVFKAEKENRLYLWLLTGIIAGLAVATRPTVLILFIIIPLHYLNTRSKFFSSSGWLKQMGLLFAGLILILLPISIRNLVVGNDFTPLPTQGGINFYIGNNPDANGWSAAMPAPLGANWQYIDCKQIAENETDRELKPGEVSDFWLIKGLEFWIDQPEQTLKLYAKKLYLLFYTKDLSNNRNLREFKNDIYISKILVFSWWLFFPLGLVGIITCYRRSIKARLIVKFIVLYSLILLLFFITSRFRLPLLPFWIIFSAVGIIQIYESIKLKHIKQLVLFFIIVACAFLWSSGLLYKVHLSNPSQKLFSQANYHFRKGDYNLAREKYRQLLNTNPAYPQANMNLAASFIKTGNLDSAQLYYQKELEVNPDSALTLSSLAEIYRLSGGSQISYRYASEAFSQKPYLSEVMINYIKAARVSGMQREALKNVERNSRYYHENPYYHFYRGILHIDLASENLVYLDSASINFNNAVKYLQQGKQPSYQREPSIFSLLFSDEKQESLLAKSYANLGVINLNKMKNEDALHSFQQALEIDSDLFQAKAGLLEVYMRVGKFAEALELIDEIETDVESSDRSRVLLYKAQAYYNLEKIEEAIETLELILSENPEFIPAQRILNAIKKGE